MRLPTSRAVRRRTPRPPRPQPPDPRRRLRRRGVVDGRAPRHGLVRLHVLDRSWVERHVVEKLLASIGESSIGVSSSAARIRSRLVALRLLRNENRSRNDVDVGRRRSRRRRRRRTAAAGSTSTGAGLGPNPVSGGDGVERAQLSASLRVAGPARRPVGDRRRPLPSPMTGPGGARAGVGTDGVDAPAGRNVSPSDAEVRSASSWSWTSDSSRSVGGRGSAPGGRNGLC